MVKPLSIWLRLKCDMSNIKINEIIRFCSYANNLKDKN